MSRPKKTAEDGAAEVAPATTETEIAPPAAETRQSEQDGAGETDSSIPAVIDPVSPPVPEALPASTGPVETAIQQVVADLRAAPGLIDVVRQAIEGFGSSLSLGTTDWRLGFPVLMHLDQGDQVLEPGQIAFVTEDEFDQLQAAQVFSRDLDWEDGTVPE